MKSIKENTDILKFYISFLNDEDILPKAYYYVIHNSLLIEALFSEELVAARKEINSALDNLEITDNRDKILITFYELYDVYHPVRNAIETIDSIQIIREVFEHLKTTDYAHTFNSEFWTGQKLKNRLMKSDKINKYLLRKTIKNNF